MCSALSFMCCSSIYKIGAEDCGTKLSRANHIQSGMTGCSESMFLPGKGCCKFMNDDQYGDGLSIPMWNHIEMYVIWYFE